VISLAEFDMVVDPLGIHAASDIVFSAECAPCPELLVGGGL
jgi:hypothetical protein